MSDSDKVKAVRDYLQSEFPGCTVKDTYDLSAGAQRFQVSGPGKAHLALITDGFLDGAPSPEIATKLRAFTLAEHLRELGSTPVVVTREGLKLQYDL